MLHNLQNLQALGSLTTIWRPFSDTWDTGLYEQDSGIINLYLLIVFGISSCLYSKAEINPNKYTAYIIPVNKTKYTIILTPKYNTKLLIKEYKQL